MRGGFFIQEPSPSNSPRDASMLILSSSTLFSSTPNDPHYFCEQGAVFSSDQLWSLACQTAQDACRLISISISIRIILPKQEEIFGPVACIAQFDSEKEVVGRVNNTRSWSNHPQSSLIWKFRYGLCASVWSENVGRVHRVSQQLEVRSFEQEEWLARDILFTFSHLNIHFLGWHCLVKLLAGEETFYHNHQPNLCYQYYHHHCDKWSQHKKTGFYEKLSQNTRSRAPEGPNTSSYQYFLLYNNRDEHHKPRLTTQVRSLGMPFGGCKESGTGMEGTR